MFLISNAYAQGAAPASAGGDFQFIFMIGMIAVVFFFMMRSQSKRTKEQKALLDSLAKGDEVVTSGGLLGRITKLGDTTIHIESGNGTELQLQRSAVIQVLPKGTLK